MPAKLVPSAELNYLSSEWIWALLPCRAITCINLERAKLCDEEDFIGINCILQLEDS